MPATLAPPPTAPAAAPAKAEIPVTQPGSISPTDKTSFDAEFEELDALDDKPKPAAKPTAKVEAPKAPEKPADKPKTEPAKEPEKPAEVPKTFKDLRAGYDNAIKEIKQTWKPKVEALEQEVANLKAGVSTNGHAAEEIKSWREKAEAAEKRAAELDSHLKFVDYKKSKEFTEKYERPYNEAWAKAISELNELTVKVRTGTDDVGEPVYGERKATANDMMTLANLPLGEARKAAKEMFGDNADDMMAHRRKIRELSDAQEKALTDAEKAAKETQDNQFNQTKAQAEEAGKLWSAANQTLAQKYPRWFAPADGDDEGNALLQKGFATVDRMFAPTPETAPKTPQEAVALHALIRNKAANHDRLALRVKKANARVAELESELEKFHASEPGADTTSAPGSAGGTDWRAEADAEIDSLNE